MTGERTTVADISANKALATLWVEEFMLTGNPAAATALVSPAFVGHDLAGKALDLASISASVESLTTGSVGHSLRIQTIVAESDLVAVYWAEEGTSVALDHGSAIAMWHRNGTSFIRIADGQITEIWQGFDMSSAPVFTAVLQPQFRSVSGH